MIPWWKFRRELTRLIQQLRAIPEAFGEPIQQRWHDQAFEKGFACLDGNVPYRGKIALVLIFQPNGLAKSTLLTCQTLVEAGYAPFIVSNTPLTKRDRNILVPLTWRVMERPNFGYDFGGYRDGIKQLWAWHLAPSHFLILNDSIWFPCVEENSLIPALEAADADISGTILREHADGSFLESYCYHINAATFSDPAFYSFWKQLKLTSNKYKVIRRGERGFSHAMVSAGKSLIGVYSRSAFLARLAGQSENFLRLTLHYAAHVHDKFEHERIELSNRPLDETWRQDMINHVARVLTKEQIYSAYCYPMVKFFGYPILKKSNDRVAKFWRAAYLRGIQDGHLPAPPKDTLHELYIKISLGS